MNTVTVAAPSSIKSVDVQQEILTPWDALEADLKRSGLIAADVDAYIAGAPELAAVGMVITHHPGGIPGGYVIPYFDMLGNRVPFYRVRIFSPRKKGAKYLQPADSLTHVYYPPGFKQLLQHAIAETEEIRTNVKGYRPILFLTEGEKKAASMIKNGFLCAAFGGIYSWKTRTLILPDNCTIDKNPNTGQVRVKLPEGFNANEEPESFAEFGTLAAGVQQLFEVITKYNIQVMICYDSDVPENPKVQKAAASLAAEMRSKGLPTTHIRQLLLPTPNDEKMGLDDFLMDYGADALQKIMLTTLRKRSAYPRHPNIKSHLNAKLQQPRMMRSRARELALTVLAELDIRGHRMLEQGTDQPYFFDSETKSLMPVMLGHNNIALHETRFGKFLYREFDLMQGDTKILPWLAASFTGELPVDTISPRSVTAVLPGDRVALQINDGQYVIISGNPNEAFRVVDNGTEGVLFRSDQVEPITAEDLMQALSNQVKTCKEDIWWKEALMGFNFLRPEDVDITTIMFYLSPWLLRWRGTQLPIEIAVGEPGSGKSTMYSLRLEILTGRPVLRNLPNDLRDWYASVTSTGGLHVTDNVHFTNKDLRQKLSDEICRIVTEPDPYIEMRQLYTTSSNIRMPVRTIFAMTAIQQPFMNADIMQRSFIFELGAVGTGHESSWVEKRVAAKGGRIAWLAHHLWKIHQFLNLAVHQRRWDDNYKSGHRLANFEQAFILMAEVLGFRNVNIVRDRIVAQMETQVSDYDWTIQGLKEFVEEHRNKLRNDPSWTFTCSDISAWASGKEDFVENIILTNARKLGRYIKSHHHMVKQSTNMFEAGSYANKATYRASLT